MKPEQGQASKTVFVKGLSYAWGKADLEEAFSNVGPIRDCFLVHEKGKPQHKGCGYVHFATAEDAQQALETLHGTLQGGRKIEMGKTGLFIHCNQVEHALRRAPFEQRKKRKREQPDQLTAVSNEVVAPKIPHPAKAKGDKAGSAGTVVRQQKPAAAGKQRLVRTVAVGTDSAAARDEAISITKELPEVEEVLGSPSEADVRNARLARDHCPDHVFFVVFKTVKAALQAIATLHRRLIDPEAAEAPKRQKNGVTTKHKAQHQLWARQVSGEGLHMKKWRLIIRNIAFNVREDDLIQLLSPAGFAWELTLPKDADGKLRGFAFAGFMCRAHAEKAIKLCNGQTLAGRPVAVDWAVAKASFQAPALAIAGEANIGGSESPTPSNQNPEAEADPGAKEAAPPAVDMAGDVDLETEKGMMKGILQQLEPTARAISTTHRQDNGGKADRRSSSMVAAKHSMVAPKSPAACDVAATSTSKEAIALYATGPQQKGDTKAADGCVDSTVFVRGLALDVLKYEVEERFRRFGHIKACRLVMDRTTGRGKGTAFVEFSDASSAQGAVAASKGHKGGLGSGVMVGGQRCEVDLALLGDDARSLAAERAASKHAAGPDKRNLYLAKEGAIVEGSVAWAGMSEADRRKRQRATVEAAAKLKSPNFAVSRMRLCLRNLPYGLDEAGLRSLVIAAVRERSQKARVAVKQVKVLREADKKGPDGKAASKGLAFVELGDHEHALCALRQLNNNPAPFGKERRPIVEFAVENVQILKKREARRAAAARTAVASQEDRPAAKTARKRHMPESEAADNVKNVVSKAVNARKSDSTGGKPSKRQRQHASPAATQQGKQPTEVMAAPGSRAGSSPTHPHQANIVSRGAHANQSRNIASREGPTRGRPPAGTKEGLMRSQVKAAKQHPSKTREIGQSAAMPERRKKAPPLRGAGRKIANASKGGDVEDRLDDMVKQYTAKYFAPSHTADKQDTRKAALARWFA